MLQGGETEIDRELGERLIGLANALRALKDHDDLEEAASTRLLVYAATPDQGRFRPARCLSRGLGRALRATILKPWPRCRK